MRNVHRYYTKLFLVIFITVVISSGLIYLITITINVKNVQLLTEQSLLSSAEQKLKIYDVNIENLHTLSKTIGNDLEIRKYFDKLSKGVDDKEFNQILQEDLKADLESYPGLLENAFFAYQGKVFLDGMGGKSTSVEINKQSEKWLTIVTTSKKHYLGKILKSPVTGSPVMISAYPILDDKNQVLAVFALAINLSGFSNAIISNSESTGENTIIIDDLGTVIAANDIELIYNYNIGTELPELYSFIETNKEGITYYTKEGTKYITAVNKSELGVSIIQSLPVSVYRNPIFISAMISFLVLVIIMGFVTVITLYVAKSITKPIQILIDEFGDMAKGNYDKEIPDYLNKRKDEFAILGKALDYMKKETRQLITNLNLSKEEIEASLEEVVTTEEQLRKQNELLSISEEQLKKSNEYNKAIITVLPDIIFIVDQNGIFTDCQVSQDNMLYLEKKLFLGKNLNEVLPEDIARIGYDKIQAALETGQLQSFEYELELEQHKEIFEMRIIKCFEDGVIAIARNITDQHSYLKQIEYLSYHDQLTGLNNRRFFEEELVRLDNEKNLPLCIIMSDVNGLKLVNDSFGHRAGDALLLKFTKVLKEFFPAENAISRVGGDEFVILIPNMNREQADNLVKSIKNKCDYEGVEALNLSVSFGWDIKTHMSENINEVLKSAEDYMYKKKLFEGPSMRGKTIDIIINTLHEKNKREEQHSHRVAELCEKLAIALKMPDHDLKVIRNAGLLHDIGKIAVQDSLLNKPGKLTREEFEDVAKHPEIGYRILCSVSEMVDIAKFVLFHHERWDGKGYPRGLAGEDIPLQSRMIAIADTFDAMTSYRTYRLPVSEEEAAKELLKHAGTQFDPELVHLFLGTVLGYHLGETS